VQAARFSRRRPIRTLRLEVGLLACLDPQQSYRVIQVAFTLVELLGGAGCPRRLEKLTDRLGCLRIAGHEPGRDRG